MAATAVILELTIQEDSPEYGVKEGDVLYASAKIPEFLISPGLQIWYSRAKSMDAVLLTVETVTYDDPEEEITLDVFPAREEHLAMILEDFKNPKEIKETDGYDGYHEWRWAN